MITSYAHGHKIEFINNIWIYSDTKESASTDRACARCRNMPTIDGYDYCIGHVAGATSACCGHGNEDPFVVWE